MSSKLIEAKAAKHRIEEELAELNTRIPKNDNQVNLLSKIEQLVAKESEWHDWRSTKNSLNDEITPIRKFKTTIT